MDITAVYINTHRYDYQFTNICAASVRYWYPNIDIFLIVDKGSGECNTKMLEKKWNIKLFETNKKKFGWGFGKLETLFIEYGKNFLVLDADTVLLGPVINKVKDLKADFLVDDEVQPDEKFSVLYYDLKKISVVDQSFIYPGYSFNTGQWFGTSGILKRSDFSEIINWAEPPTSKFPSIIFQGEQGHMNFLIHKMEQNRKIKICRKKLMIWPDGANADFIDLDKIKNKNSHYPFILHWAGIKFKSLKKYPRADILLFYRQYYYNHLSYKQELFDKLFNWYLIAEKIIRLRFFKRS